jgi:hypothetical protein
MPRVKKGKLWIINVWQKFGVDEMQNHLEHLFFAGVLVYYFSD